MKILILLAHFKFEISSLIFTIFVYITYVTHVETIGKNLIFKKMVCIKWSGFRRNGGTVF
jgi:hypothetical protein